MASKKAADPFNPKPRYTVPEASQALGVSRALIYQRIRSGALRCVRDGNRVLIIHGELMRYAELNHE